MRLYPNLFGADALIVPFLGDRPYVYYAKSVINLKDLSGWNQF
jgi:hypothetical protein